MRSWEILVSSWDALVSSWGSLVSSWGVLVSSWAGLVSSSMYKSPRSSRGSSRGLLRSSRVLRRNSPGLRRNSRGLRRLPRDAEELSRELPRAAEEHPRAAEELPRDADSSNKKLICNTRRMPLDEVSAKRFWNSLQARRQTRGSLLTFLLTFVVPLRLIHQTLQWRQKAAGPAECLEHNLHTSLRSSPEHAGAPMLHSARCTRREVLAAKDP